MLKYFCQLCKYIINCSQWIFLRPKRYQPAPLHSLICIKLKALLTQTLNRNRHVWFEKALKISLLPPFSRRTMKNTVTMAKLFCSNLEQRPHPLKYLTSCKPIMVRQTHRPSCSVLLAHYFAFKTKKKLWKKKLKYFKRS